jgi:hypothetical protein
MSPPGGTLSPDLWQDWGREAHKEKLVRRARKSQGREKPNAI